MKRMSDEYLLSEMKRKIDELGRTPTKDEIDMDKSMPHSYTYFERFGGITYAIKMIGETPVRRLPLSMDEFLEFIRKYHATNGTVPTSNDFDADPHYPHSSYVRDKGISWVQAIKLAKLSPYTRGETWIKSRSAELKVRDLLLSGGHDVVDLKEEDTKNGSFVVDGKLIKIRSSSIYHTNYKGTILKSWKFKLHHSSPVKADYYICVGIHEGEIMKLYVLPADKVNVTECVSIPYGSKRISKYDGFEIGLAGLKEFAF